VRDPRIELAFAETPREKYAGPGPWMIVASSGYVRTPDADPARLYHDVLVAIDASRGVNIGEPALHALCLDALALKDGETVVHVGAGVGYYTAMLVRLVGPRGSVIGYEIDPDIAGRARANLRDVSGVVIEARSGVVAGLPEADAIYVNAGAVEPYRCWLDALKPGGRLLFPLQSPGGIGAMLLIERPREGGAWPARFLVAVSFIACEVARDSAAERRLEMAFSISDYGKVRSLRFDAPDDTCWLECDGCWLSTSPPA
jgi:protein-L-isoaspartate(D-aspartate) O-methyltransferase